MVKIVLEKSNIQSRCGLLLVLGILIYFSIHLYKRTDQIVNSKISNSPVILNSGVLHSDQPCTFGFLRRFFDKNGYFPGAGKWYLNGSDSYFEPDACRLKYKRFPVHAMATCIRKSGIQSIKTIGDSNGGKNGVALASAIGKCRIVKGEQVKDAGFKPDVAYFQNTSEAWSPFLTAHFRYCMGCASFVRSCSVQGGKAVDMEHIAMTMILDDALQIQYPTYKHSSVMRSAWALTSQEFYIKYYLKYKYPDIFLIFLPFNHAKHLSNDTVAPQLEYFRMLIQKFAPEKTRIFFMPAFTESETKRAHASKWTNATFENMLSTDRIDALNHMMNQIMRKDFLARNGRTYGFFDLLNITRPRDSWHTDGVHMIDTWYQIAMSMFWETLCNSVNLDEF